MVCTTVDTHRLVVPADRVQRIGDLGEAGDRYIDLAALLGVVIPPPTPRRALQLSTGPSRPWILAGEHVAVRRLPHHAFVELPRWLHAWIARVPLASVVRVDGTFGFELDVPRLVLEHAT